jgi:hypothetical protein
LTISNPGDNEVTGTLRFFTPGGSEWSLSINSTVGSAFPFTLPAHGYVTKYASQAFPNIPSTFKGNLIGEVSGNGAMAVLGLTQKEALYSAIPVDDPSLAVAKRIFGEWGFRFGQYAPSFSIRAIEDDSSGSGQIYAWGYDYQGHTSVLINWGESRQSYIGIQSNPVAFTIKPAPPPRRLWSSCS